MGSIPTRGTKKGKDMGDVILMRNSLDVAATLKRIATQIESGELVADAATLIIGTNVFHFGHVLSDANAAQETIWDCTYAIHKLMSTALST